MTMEEKRDRIKAEMLDPVNFAKSDRALADHVGSGVSSVQRYRAQLIPLIEDPDNPLGLDSVQRGELLELIRPRAGAVVEEEPKMRFTVKAELPFDVPPADAEMLVKAVRMLLSAYRIEFDELDSSSDCKWDEEATYQKCESLLGGLPESMVYRFTLAKSELYRRFLAALPSS